MTLSESQQVLVRDYLDAVGASLNGVVSESRRRDTVVAAERDIDAALAELPGDRLEDSTLARVLDRLGPPAAHAQRLNPSPAAATAGFALDRANAVWLGVCAGLARQFGLAPWMVRVGALGLGFITAGFALWLYLGLFLFMFFTMPKAQRPRVTWARLIQYPLYTVLAALALHYFAYYTIDGIDWVYAYAMKQDTPPLGQWDWIRSDLDSWSFWSIAWGLPLALIAGLPIVRGWEHSLRRLIMAGLAIYGILLAYGIGSLLAGLTLEFVEQIGDSGTVIPFL